MKYIGKSYQIRSSEGFEKTMAVLSEQSDSLSILLTTQSAWGQNESREDLPKHLFETCLRTGYLSEIKRQSLTLV